MIKDLQSNRTQEDDNAWADSRHTESGWREYLNKYPTGKHIAEAKQKIDKLEQQRRTEQAAKQEILENVRRDPSFSYRAQELYNYLKNGTISRDDLLKAGVPDDIIDCLNNTPPQLNLGDTPDYIPDGYTEVYFWGTISSGKTCALGAVLKTAGNLGYLEIAPGPGYDYMLQLKNIFSNPISVLPADTFTDSTQYLPFALRKPHENSRSVSLIELSGEIFQCFLYKNANKPLPSPDHEKGFNSLITFLNGRNRKIHFFFVDYDSENNPDSDGYTQADYLNAAATFFNDKRNNLFSKTTVAIYIVVTKSDLMDCTKDKRVNQVSQYLENNNYIAFVNSLRAKCKENSINGGKILGIPFTLGKVYFHHLCILEDDTSKNIIDILMRRIAPKRKSILDIFNR
jgi:hypothetical protein